MELTKQLQKEFEDEFTDIGCFDGTFSFQVKPDSKSYQVPPRCIPYVLQKPFKEKLERLQQQEIITLLDIDETVERCNSLIFILKPNGKVRLCLDPARLNQALIRPVHRGPTLIDIFPKLNNVKYLSLTHVSSQCHNFKLDMRSSYLTTFVCQFGRYRYKRLPFGAAPTSDMFHHNIGEIFKNVPNIFGIADDILVVCYDIDGKDHDEMLLQVLQICRHVNLKLNKYKCHFKFTSVQFFGEVISRHGMLPDPHRLKLLTNIPPPKTKKKLQAFLSIISCLGKFPSSTAEVCEPKRKLTSAKTEWTWNAAYQKMFDKTKAIIKEDAYMRFYDKTKPLYIEADASGVGLGAAPYKQEAIQAVTEMMYQTITSSGQMHFPAKASLGLRRDTAILKEKQRAYYMALKNFIIIALQER